MKTNRKNIMKKNLQLMLLTMTLNTSLVANDVEKLSNAFWQRTFVNTCTESFTFNSSGNSFTYVSSFGKKMLGRYIIEKVRNSERLKVTFKVTIDNGLKDCSSSNYNSTNEMIVNYLWLEKNAKTLNFSTEKQGTVFNTYNYIESYTSEKLTLVQLYVAQLALNEIQQLQSNTQSIQQQVAAMQRKQNEESIALNKKIFEQLKASQVQNKTSQSSANNDWKKYLNSEQLISQQNFENRLDDERRAQRDEDYRSQEIQNDYIQQSYIQEQINQDYYNQ